MISHRILMTLTLVSLFGWELSPANGQDEAWTYDARLLRPFWEGDRVEGESVLFIKDAQTGEAQASVLFPIRKIVSVTDSTGNTRYEEGRDFTWKPGSRTVTLPAKSRIVVRTPEQLRRPAKTQKYELTHRDGNGEIFFGGRLEYAEMQTCITYEHEPNLWKSVPKRRANGLPRATQRLAQKQPLAIVVLGDSISAGYNSSKLGKGAPFQPAYPGLLEQHLSAQSGSRVSVTNLAINGRDSAWGLTQIEAVVAEKPDVVVLAFGMNDSAGRSAAEFQKNTRQMIANVQEKLPNAEFVLVAPMLGNRDWIRLRHEVFPEYRDVLGDLCKPGIALADLTSIWTEILQLKKDWDQTGNGVNHPNDWGHRVYAQVIANAF